MDSKRFIGFVLILIGVLLGLSKIVLTGSIIGETNASIFGIIGAIITILGLLFILAAGAPGDEIEESSKS